MPTINKSLHLEKNRITTVLSTKRNKNSLSRLQNSPRAAAQSKRDNDSALSSSLLRKLNESDDDMDLEEIKEARMASRKAIELMMKGIKSRTRPVWVPSGDQEKVFHSNARPSPKRSKVRA